MKYESCVVLTPDGGSLVFRNIDTKAEVVRIDITGPEEAEQLETMVSRLRDHLAYVAYGLKK